MIVAQPTACAAMTADMPTPPVPNTAIDEPAGGHSVFMTAPAPVRTPQPRGAATSNGRSSGMRTTLRSEATARVAKLDWPKKWECRGRPSRASDVEPSGRDARKLRAKKSWHEYGRPVRHVPQSPQESKLSTT